MRLGYWLEVLDWIHFLDQGQRRSALIIEQGAGTYGFMGWATQLVGVARVRDGGLR